MIAGKGHETQQIYKNKLYNISDKGIIKKINKKFKNINNEKQNYLQNRSLLNEILGKSKPIIFKGVSIDTRTIRKNNLFIALKGKSKDGNDFISEALKKGAGGIVTSSLTKNKRKIIRVKNSISFLNNFAKLKRKKTSAKIIAITGSAGKTSLKELLTKILKNFGNTHYSPKSYNNHLGVPISLSNIKYEDKFGVFEIGMSRSGEIKNLSKLIKPHFGIITNIGEAHIENFRNISGIAKAKSELIENIRPGGTIILNRDDKFFNYMNQKAKSYKLHVTTFGKHKNSDVRIQKIVKKNNNSKITIIINNNHFNFEVNDQNIYNILASIAVLKELKLNFNKILSKFKSFELAEGRGKKHCIIRYKKFFKLIDESYNANPTSVKNAVNKLNLIKKQKFKKYLILGDMLELGSKSKKYHEDLSKVINNSDIDKVFIKGNKTIFTYKHLSKDKGVIFYRTLKI